MQTKGDLINHQGEAMHLSNSTTKVGAGNAHYAINVEGCTSGTTFLGSQFVLDVESQGTFRGTTGPLPTTKPVIIIQKDRKTQHPLEFMR
jgi:hypothetical protein